MILTAGTGAPETESRFSAEKCSQFTGESNGEIGRHRPLRDEIAEIPVLDILLGLPGERVNNLPLLRRRAREAARRLEEPLRARDRHPAADSIQHPCPIKSKQHGRDAGSGPRVRYGLAGRAF